MWQAKSRQRLPRLRPAVLSRRYGTGWRRETVSVGADIWPHPAPVVPLHVHGLLYFVSRVSRWSDVRHATTGQWQAHSLRTVEARHLGQAGEESFEQVPGGQVLEGDRRPNGCWWYVFTSVTTCLNVNLWHVQSCVMVFINHGLNKTTVLAIHYTLIK